MRYEITVIGDQGYLKKLHTPTAEAAFRYARNLAKEYPAREVTVFDHKAGYYLKPERWNNRKG